MRVLGIDPGYAIVGWGVVDYAGNRFAPVDFGAVCTDAGVPFERRLDEVYAASKRSSSGRSRRCWPSKSCSTSTTRPPSSAWPRPAASFCWRRRRRACHLRVHPDAGQAGRHRLRQSVKKQVQEMTRILLHLPAIPKPDDTADALAMAITFCHTNGSQLNRFVRRVPGPI